MKVLHFVILLCVLAFPLRAFAAAPDLPALLFVEAAASEAAYSGELSELLRARLSALRPWGTAERLDVSFTWCAVMSMGQSCISSLFPGRSAAVIYGRICG